MASFPGSVKTFTGKTDGAGNPINAAHINELQDEVNAIEAGYINGTAPLNSSRSTLAALVVSGGTTLASLTVSGGTTLANLQVAGSTFSVRPILTPPDVAVVYLPSTVTIGSSGASTLSWVAQDVLTNSSMHSTGTNPERLTPQTTGLYQVAAQVDFSSTQAGRLEVSVRDSTGDQIAGIGVAASSRGNTLPVFGLKRFDALGGYVTCRIGLVGQSTMSLSSGIGVSWFSLVKL